MPTLCWLIRRRQRVGSEPGASKTTWLVYTLSILPTLDGEPIFNRLLAVVFYSPDRGFGDVFDELGLCECLGHRVVGGGAFHPYDERLVMLLGDPARCDQPSHAIKAELGPGDLPAIYE